MLYLSDIRDYIGSLGIAVDDNVYNGKMADKVIKSIGVYNLKRSRPPNIAIGGIQNSSYGIKSISLLVHWNKSQREAERAAQALWCALHLCRGTLINDRKILFISNSNDEPISVDADDNGIYEYVIECDFYYERNDDNE